jgi:hypothetical protein
MANRVGSGDLLGHWLININQMLNLSIHIAFGGASRLGNRSNLWPLQSLHQELNQRNVIVTTANHELAENLGDVISLRQMCVNVVKDSLVMRTAILIARNELCGLQNLATQSWKCVGHTKWPNEKS